jgi:integrase
VHRRVWAPRGKTPLAWVRPRYRWLYVYGFVRPSTGESEFWLLPTVNAEAFSEVLRRFARLRGAGERKLLLVVLNRAGWHVSGRGVKPVDPEAFNHYLRRLAERAGLGRVRVHDLRHTWATLALSRGIPLEVVSERLGHASPTITLNVYRHLLEEERRGYVLDLEDLLFPGPRAIS